MALTYDNIPLSFVRGNAANLPATGSANVKDGRFYLTKDTERLYVGIGTNLVELNKSIRMVSTLSALPATDTGVAVGDFYYVASGSDGKSGNILAVCDSISASHVPHWTQINPDTNTELTAKGQDTTVTSVANSDVATIAHIVSDSSTNSSIGTFQIEAGNNISLSVEGNKIKLDVPAGALYAFGSSAAAQGDGKAAGVALKLTQNPNDTTSANAGTVNLRGDGIHITVADEGNGEVKISSVNPFNTGLDITPIAEGFTIAVEDGGLGVQDTLDPVISLKADNNTTAQDIHFASGTAELPVYTKTQTDTAISDAVATAIKNFNAMEYQGTVTSATLASKTNVKNGYTYVASDDSADGSTPSFKAGDLIIAKGTEGADGYIASPVYEVVNVGTKQVVEFSTDATTGIAKVYDAVNAAGYKVDAGNKLDVTYSVTDGVVDAVVSHEAITAPTTTGSTADVTQSMLKEATFSAITALTEDGYGHVTGVTTHQIKVVDTHANIDPTSSSTTVKAANQVGTVAITVADTDGPEYTANFGVSATADDNLTVDASNNNITLAMVWGTF